MVMERAKTAIMGADDADSMHRMAEMWRKTVEHVHKIEDAYLESDAAFREHPDNAGRIVGCFDQWKKNYVVSDDVEYDPVPQDSDDEEAVSQEADDEDDDTPTTA